MGRTPRHSGAGTLGDGALGDGALGDGMANRRSIPGGSLPGGITPDQFEAVSAPDPVLCVLAGAGTGKTRVLTLRIARRVRDGSALAEHVLACTFSRKAADELGQRLWTLGVADEVVAGTFHRTALGLIRRHRLDHTASEPALLTDRRTLLAELLGTDSWGALDPAREQGGPRAGAASQFRVSSQAARARRPLSAVAQLDTEIGWAKARLVSPDRYPDAARRDRRRPPRGVARTAELYELYERTRRQRRLLDFDDLIWAAADLVESDTRFAQGVRWRYRHVFVDEMQDVNPAQFRLLRAIVGDEPDLCVVGDPWQSVYGWNGADPEMMNLVPVMYPETRVIRLGENHRCSPQIVAVASAALGLGSCRDAPVDPVTALAGADSVGGRVAGGARGVEGRGERVEGRGERETGGGWVPTSTRPDGPVPRLVEHATDEHEAAWVSRQVWLMHRPGTRWRHIAVLARTNSQLELVARALTAEKVPFSISGREWEPSGDAGHDQDVVVDPGVVDPGIVDPGARHATLGNFDHGEPLAESPTAQGAVGATGLGDAVTLSTFHRAKGLQWPIVFVIGLSNGLVPLRSARAPAALEEERRLLYVALTRAERELTGTWAVHSCERDFELGRPPRAPSPWLVPMQQTCSALQRALEEPSAEQVAAHLDEVRSLLAEAGLPARGAAGAGRSAGGRSAAGRSAGGRSAGGQRAAADRVGKDAPMGSESTGSGPDARRG